MLPLPRSPSTQTLRSKGCHESAVETRTDAGLIVIAFSSAAFNMSNVSLGLGVNSLNATQALNGFMATSSPGMNSAAVPSVSPITAIASGLCTAEPAYFEETNAQFGTLSASHPNDFDGRNRQMPGESDVGGPEQMGVAHTPPTSRMQPEAENRAGATASLAHSILESSIRRSVHDHQFNQTVNNRK